jgi:hypothetical protein
MKSDRTDTTEMTIGRAEQDQADDRIRAAVLPKDSEGES